MKKNTEKVKARKKEEKSTALKSVKYKTARDSSKRTKPPPNAKTTEEKVKKVLDTTAGDFTVVKHKHRQTRRHKPSIIRYSHSPNMGISQVT